MKYILAALLFLAGMLYGSTQGHQAELLKLLFESIKEKPDAYAILITGLLAAVVAVWGIISQRALTRRQMTVQILSEGENDVDLNKAHAHFIKLVKKHGNLDEFAGADKEGSEDVRHIMTVLNRFELLAVGIERGIIDYEIYALWYKSSVVRHWSHAEKLIFDIRRRLANDALFREFETMVGWFKGQEPPKRGYRWGQWF